MDGFAAKCYQSVDRRHLSQMSYDRLRTAMPVHGIVLRRTQACLLNLVLFKGVLKKNTSDFFGVVY